MRGENCTRMSSLFFMYTSPFGVLCSILVSKETVEQRLTEPLANHSGEPFDPRRPPLEILE
jgi:hypothetical protein